jgi:polar amino acid transport system substrate-binding protein
MPAGGYRTCSPNPSLARAAVRLGSALLGFLLIMLTIAQSSAQAPGSAIARIQQSGTLTVAVFFEDVAPFFYTDAAGAFVGVDPALAQDIAEKLGVEIAYNRAATTFDGVVDEVVEGRADIAISLLSDTLERATRVSFSRSYVGVRQYMLINRLALGQILASNDSRSIPELLNNKASRIGVISGTSYVGFAEEDFPNAQRIEFDTWNNMLAALKAGDLVALMYDEIEIGNWRLADPAGSLQLRPFHLEGHSDTIAIAIRQTDTDLKAWIDLYLTKAEENGSLASILNAYLYSSDRLLADD